MTAAELVDITNPLTEHAAAIRMLGKQTIENAIEIGRRLVDCRDNHLEHGQWLPWLEREFGWSRQHADNLIHFYEAREKLPNFGNLNLPLSGLYLLAAPSTPETARNAVLERAKSGEILPVKEVKRVVREHKQAYRPNPRQTEFADASEWGAHKAHFARKEARQFVKQWMEAEWGYETRRYFLQTILDDSPETIIPGINAWLKKCRLPSKRVTFIKKLVVDVEGFDSLRAKRRKRLPGSPIQ
jgi:hypothetical protein